jgi:hypothetical protein
MNRRPGPHETSHHYELRVEGHLDAHWSTWFGGLTLSHEEDGTTALRGVVTDQAELHGLLAKVRDLGATLVSVTTTDARDRPTDTCPSEPAVDRPRRMEGGLG